MPTETSLGSLHPNPGFREPTNSGLSRANDSANVATAERIGSILMAGGMIVAGMRSQGTVTAKLLSAAGAVALLRRGLTGSCPAYRILGMSTARSQGLHGPEAFKIEESVIVNRPADALYAFWRNLSNLPQVMPHISQVTEMGNKTSHWIAKGPAGFRVEWNAEIINDHPNELIAWRSLEGSDVDSAGSVRFEPHWSGYGTMVKVTLMLRPPAGKLGNYILGLFGKNPKAQIKADMARFKQFMEAGETLRGSPIETE